MNELTVREFNGTNVGFRFNGNGQSEVSIDAVAKFCGWERTEIKNGIEYKSIRMATVNKFLKELGFANEMAKGGYIPEYIMYPLIGKANNEKATKFMLWVGQVLTEIRQTGSYKLPGSYKEALLQLVQAEDEKEVLTIEVKQKDQVIKGLQPKADYTDMILKSKSLVAITQIAKDYGMSGQEMNKLLHKLKVQYKLKDQWLLYGKHQSAGYVHSETFPFFHKNGRKEVKMNTSWTQKGRLFLYDLLKSNNVLPIIEIEVDI